MSILSRYGILLVAAVGIAVGTLVFMPMHHPQVHLGINAWTGYDPLLLAESLALFEADNIPVKIHSFDSTSATMEGLKSGKLQGGGLTLDETFSLLNEGVNIKAVLVMDYSLGGDMIVAQSNITSVSALKNKRVGYEGTVVSEFLLHRALQIHQLMPDEVQLVKMPPSNWVDAFYTEQIDALVCYNPFANQLMKNHKGNLLFSSAAIPYEVIDVLVFREDFLNQHPDTVIQIARAWFKALAYLQQSPDDAVLRIGHKRGTSMVHYFEDLEGIIAPDAKTNQHLFDLQSPENIYKYSQYIVEFMLSKNLLNSRQNNLELFDPSIVSAIQAQ